MFLSHLMIRTCLLRTMMCLAICCMLKITAAAQDTAVVKPPRQQAHPVRAKRDSIIRSHRDPGNAKRERKKELAAFMNATYQGLAKARESYRDNNFQPGFWLGSNLLAPANPWEQGANLTLEYRFNLHWALSGSYTAIFRSVVDKQAPDYTPYDVTGFRMGAHVKYFIPKGNLNRLFIGVEVRVKRSDYKIFQPHIAYLENYDYGQLLQPEREDPRTLTSWGIAPTFGIQRMIGKRMQFEFYLGIGACYRSLNRHGTTSTANEATGCPPVDGFGIAGFGKTDKDIKLDRVTANMPLGVRIAFLLSKPKK